ncbi:hypothetical protein AKJ16_DCAP10175 [Drosera capensis]
MDVKARRKRPPLPATYPKEEAKNSDSEALCFRRIRCWPPSTLLSHGEIDLRNDYNDKELFLR